jgi:hypothetical protein
VVARTPAEFAAAVRGHPFGTFDFAPERVRAARAALASAGMLVVGEPHGVRETPSALASLASILDVRAVAFEWSHEEMDPALVRFVRTGAFDLDALWSLPGSAELFCGDGRITAGHFALMDRLRSAGRLEQVIAFDRLDADPAHPDAAARERDMAERLLREWDGRSRMLVAVGAFHARIDRAAGETMASHLAARVPGLAPAMLAYRRGQAWSRGLHDVAGAMPPAPIVLTLPFATPAVVPGRPATET